MNFLKKLILACLAVGLIFIGGFSAQSGSLAFQGMGFIILIVGLIILFVFMRMIWRAMGCLPSLFIVVGILSFILYAIGGFKNGIEGTIPYLREFLGQVEEAPAGEKGKVTISEYFSNKPEEPSNNKQPSEERGLSFFSSSAKVVSGDTLRIGGKLFRLYGIDAPELDQYCSDKYGRPYTCGQKAARWLRNWIEDGILDCQIVYLSEDGNMLGVCAFGDYDLGAALVNAGWALAYTGNTDVYVPYQAQAKKNNRGLWGGSFTPPETWRKNQAKMAEDETSFSGLNGWSLW